MISKIPDFDLNKHQNRVFKSIYEVILTQYRPLYYHLLTKPIKLLIYSEIQLHLSLENEEGKYRKDRYRVIYKAKYPI
jgi:hypothetical protein